MLAGELSLTGFKRIGAKNPCSVAANSALTCIAEWQNPHCNTAHSALQERMGFCGASAFRSVNKEDGYITLEKERAPHYRVSIKLLTKAFRNSRKETIAVKRT